MKKLLLVTLLSVTLLLGLTVSHTYAAPKESLLYLDELTETFTVDEKGGHFDIGFTTVIFRNGFLDEDELPITFEVKLYAENGEVFIEFTPDVEVFEKEVIVHVFAFEGYIYDVATGEYVFVDISNNVFKVEHFSRYCYAW